MSMREFAAVRKERRRALIGTKRRRRIGVGPSATFFFENYDTMWFQVHEMLFIEGGGDPQIQGELEAYNPLIPKGRELIATLMFELDDPEERQQLLTRLEGVQKAISFMVGDQTVPGVVEEEVGEPRSDGKVSSVHFVHFPFLEEQIQAFFGNDCAILLRINHPAYQHHAILDTTIRSELSKDFDIHS